MPFNNHSVYNIKHHKYAASSDNLVFLQSHTLSSCTLNLKSMVSKCSTLLKVKKEQDIRKVWFCHV